MHDNHSDLTAGGTSVIMCNALLYCKKCYHMSCRSMQIIALFQLILWSGEGAIA